MGKQDRTAANSPRSEGRSEARSEARSEGGAVLVLALIFLTVASLIVGALSAWTVNDLKNIPHFTSARSLQYAARNATNVAVQSIRYTPLLSAGQTLNAWPPSYCWGTGSPSQLPSTNGAPQLSVWCSTVFTPTSANTRVVTLSTCLSTVTAANCASNPLLQAVVTFDDYPPGTSAPSTGQCVTYCGASQTIGSWVWSPVAPTVTAINGLASGPSAGGTPITLTGTGFVAGSTVTFVQESGGLPASANVLFPGTGVAINSPTSISVVSPAVSSGTTYFVTVTTPTGTSAYGPIFTYPPAGLAVTALNITAGPYTGGTSVIITGTGFVNNSTVNFTQESNGIPAVPTVTVPATNIAVISTTSITAVSPAVTVGTTYFVTVTTPSGTSAFSANAVFTYPPQPPTVSGVSPSSGPSAGGTPITINGTGFAPGATVSLIEESGGTAVTPPFSVAATAVILSSATSITAVAPGVTVGSTYFVTVTTATGTSVASNASIYSYTARSYSTWPLSEVSGSTANDTSGNSHNGSYSATGVSYGLVGPYPSGSSKAVSFDGATGSVTDPVGVAVTATSAQSDEVWFKTSTATGGVLITSYSSPTLATGTADRVVYMNSSGQVVFGVYNGATKTINSPKPYNDGSWHLVDAVFDPTAGVSLYIDGSLVATSSANTVANRFPTAYTRVASGQLTGWPNAVGTLPSYWQGSEAFASIYYYALSANQVGVDYAAAEGS